MKKLHALFAVLLLPTLAACAEDGITAADLDQPQFNKNARTYNGPTNVIGTFTISMTSSSGTVAPGVNMHPQGKGECRNANGAVSSTQAENTVWYNSQGQATGSKFCEGSVSLGGGTMECDIVGIPATYASAGNDPFRGGNENLNFLTNEEGEVNDQFVHFKAQAGTTGGKGTVDFSYTCDSLAGEGSLALEQFGDADEAPYAGNLFVNRSSSSRGLNTAGVTVVTEHGTGTVTALYWSFRSRVQ